MHEEFKKKVLQEFESIFAKNGIIPDEDLRMAILPLKDLFYPGLRDILDEKPDAILEKIRQIREKLAEIEKVF